MNILGISAYYHDSAAVLLVDGDIRTAVQEERFTRIKHDHNFPVNAINFCLNDSGIESGDIDYIVYYDKPLLKFDRLIETYIAYAPKGFNSFSKAMPLWLKQKLFIKSDIRKKLGGKFKGKIVFTEHHESHAASAFFPSPFEEAAILTVDGVGEWATASIGRGNGNRIEILKEMKFPHSLGLIYSAFTYFSGFKVNSGEYKLMGLAPYGKPVYVDIIKGKLVDIKNDGSIWLDLSYFNYCAGLTMTSGKFDDLFGGPPRNPESQITRREMDIAASIQAVTEDIMIRMSRHAQETTGCRNLCLAGGVALNCVANGKIMKESIFDKIWIQPAAGDAGGALGAAMFVWHQLLGRQRKVKFGDSQKGSLLGTSYTNEEIKLFLDGLGAKYEFHEEKALVDRTADYIASGKVIGWFYGKMEFGPRSLGARSIIGDARSKDMQAKMNLKIKYRESFRPFAPCVLAEDADKYFDLDYESPYMLIVAPVKEGRRTQIDRSQKEIMAKDPDLCKRVNIPRSEIPAVTHIDYSARIQTVDKNRHGRYYEVIRRFKEKTGCSVIINTSFNIRGEPIVCSPADAFRCFMNCEMDILVLENFILRKEDQNNLDKKDVEEYKKQFKLD
jgi:carbamoyltransferase